MWRWAVDSTSSVTHLCRWSILGTCPSQICDVGPYWKSTFGVYSKLVKLALESLNCVWCCGNLIFSMIIHSWGMLFLIIAKVLALFVITRISPQLWLANQWSQIDQDMNVCITFTIEFFTLLVLRFYFVIVLNILCCK